jgi:hypothetical protein
MAVGPVAARQSDRRDACCLIRDYLSGTEYQGPAAPVQWPGSKHATPGPSRGCQAGQRRAAATAPAGQVPLARCGHECAGPSDVGTKEMIAGQYWQNRARPHPPHRRRVTPPAQPPRPRHPPRGIPPAMVRLETPPAGHRPEIPLRPPGQGSPRAVVPGRRYPRAARGNCR